jgi:hypothetical protein
MAKVKQRQFGGLPPKYSFIINPYPEERVSHQTPPIAVPPPSQEWVKTKIWR